MSGNRVIVISPFWNPSNFPIEEYREDLGRHDSKRMAKAALRLDPTLSLWIWVWASPSQLSNEFGYWRSTTLTAGNTSGFLAVTKSNAGPPTWAPHIRLAPKKYKKSLQRKAMQQLIGRLVSSSVSTQR